MATDRDGPLEFPGLEPPVKVATARASARV